METQTNTPTFKLETFEGPLDLLLHLIAKNKVDIYHIPVAEILEQYLAYMEQARAFNIELASEFTVMAAQLLYIKSSMILPKYDEPEEDPRRELVETLVEYQLFKTMRPYFEARQEEFDGSFTKLPEAPVPVPVAEYGLSPDLLTRALEQMLRRREELKEEPEFRLETVLSRESLSLDEKVGTILSLFKEKKTLSLRRLYETAKSRRELIVTFLAVLELCKDRHVYLSGEGEDCSLEIGEPETDENNENAETKE